MGATTIEWTDFSWNPIRARLRDEAHAGLTKGGYDSGVGHYCEKISAGCANCYASTMQPRFGLPQFPGARKPLATLPFIAGAGCVPVTADVELWLDERVLLEPLKWRKPKKVFGFDMTDLFGSWVPFEWIDRIWAVMGRTPHITYQVLTKRPHRLEQYLTQHATHDRMLNQPLPNVWLGTSVENQPMADARIPVLLDCPAAVRFLSIEPLLGPIDLKLNTYWNTLGRNSTLHLNTSTTRRSGLGWAIVGGESGPGARPMHPDWVRSLRDQCQSGPERHRVPFFFKQWGEHAPCAESRLYVSRRDGKTSDMSNAVRVRRNGNAVMDVEDRDDMAPMRRVGKKEAGRMLDGRTWDEMPAVASAEGGAR